MKTTLALSALALLAVLGTGASADLSVTQPGHQVTSSVSDPDPADCPFCGGNPTLHVGRMFDLQRITLGMYSSLLR